MDNKNKNMRRDEVNSQNANGDSPDNKENQTNKEKNPAEDIGIYKKERNNTDDDNIGNDVTIGEEEVTIGEEEVTIGEEEVTIGEEEILENEDMIDDIEDGPIFY